MKQMVKDHQKDVKEYHEASLKADDPDIRAFAVQTLPVLQAHLDRAKEIEGRLSK
jgi:putative membrane protein